MTKIGVERIFSRVGELPARLMLYHLLSWKRSDIRGTNIKL
jgi:hypothetical protein